MSIEPTITTKAARAITRIEAPVNQEEQTLTARAKSGDPSAFEALVVPHRQRILRLIQRILRNREDAEDAVQIALLQAFSHLDDFQGNAQFSSWLSRIAVNAALMRLRTIKRKCETSLDQMVADEDSLVRFQVIEVRPNPEQNYLARERRAILSAAVRQLGPRNRAVLDLRDTQGLSAKETAQVLGIAASTVKARLHRARLKLMQRAQLMLATKARKLPA